MEVQIINKSGLPLPEYARSGDAGVDLRASFAAGVNEDLLSHAAYDNEGGYIIIFSGGRALIPTNNFIKLPEGYELQIRPRSGLALKEGITVLNTPGTIDSEYTGNIGVILINFGEEPFIVKDGERIAQAVLNKYEKIEWKLVDELIITDRGASGFGDSGKQ